MNFNCRSKILRRSVTNYHWLCDIHWKIKTNKCFDFTATEQHFKCRPIGREFSTMYRPYISRGHWSHVDPRLGILPCHSGSFVTFTLSWITNSQKLLRNSRWQSVVLPVAYLCEDTHLVGL